MSVRILISHMALPVLVMLPSGVQAQRVSTWAAGHQSHRPLADSPAHDRLAFGVSPGVGTANRVQELETGQRSGVTLAFGGLVGGTLGFFAGGLSGVALCDCDEIGEGLDELEAFFWGAAVGTAVTIPLGVHAANRWKGSFGASLAASAAISAVGLAVAFGTDEPAILVVIPVSQIISSVFIERRTTQGFSSAR